MQEQVDALKKINIPAAAITAGMHRADIVRTLNNAIAGGYKLLYISPERLQSALFNEYLPAIDVMLIAVDEAHCISQWGHDFRPDYLKIATLRDTFPSAPIIAVTASATIAIEKEITAKLKFRNGNIFRQSFERANIFYSSVYSEQKLNDTLNILSQNPGSSIIYCRSRKLTEQLSRQLIERQINTVCYHAGMTKQMRSQNQQLWMYERVPVIVATTAFGMGIDKPDVRNVLHYDIPEQPEAYYQESGRAGRNGKPANATILYNHSDIQRLEESIDIQFPPYDFIRRVYQSVAEYLQVPIGAEPHRYYNFETDDFCQKFNLPVRPALRALKLLEQEGLWTLTDAVYSPTSVMILAGRAELEHLGTTYPEIHMLITTMLRLYGTLFQHPTPVNLNILAKHLKTTSGLISQLLDKLDDMDIVEYLKPRNAPQLFFHHYRVDSQQLIINTERINRLKLAHVQRTTAMIAYTTDSRQCRNKILLNYFGEQANVPCGHCDNCRKKAPTPSEQSIETAILSLLVDGNTLSVSELVTSIKMDNKELIINTIRRLIDNKTLELVGTNQVRLKQSG